MTNKREEISARLNRAKNDAKKTFAKPGEGSPKVGDTVMPCLHKVTVIIVAEDIACPAHDHIVKARGTPGGGTYRWSVSSLDVQLLDAKKQPVGMEYIGDTVYLRCFKPNHTTGHIPSVKTKVQVTYIHSNGTAQDKKTIVFHGVQFNVTNFKIDKGVATTEISFKNCTATLGGDGWRDGVRSSPLSIYKERDTPTIITAQGRVQILIDKSCPRANYCAKSYQLGWHQVIHKDVKKLRYARSLWSYSPLKQPVRDGDDDNPWFNLEGTLQLFEQNRQTLTAKMRDSPEWTILDIHDFRYSSLLIEFTTWLMVENREWIENGSDPERAYFFLKNFDWSCRAYIQAYLKGKKIDFQSSSNSPDVGTPTDGKGKQKPVIIGPTMENTGIILDKKAAPFIPLQVYDPENPPD